MPDPDATTLVGALADPLRRKVFAAIELGATTVDAVLATTRANPRDVTDALGKLTASGAVMATDSGLAVGHDAFIAAVRAARSRPRTAEHNGAPDDQRKVLDVFVRDGRIVQIPMALGKKRVILDWLAQDFEPGRRYTEAAVNLIIGKRHPDTAAWRRYLVDEEFMTREDGIYWRIGGSVGNRSVAW